MITPDIVQKFLRYEELKIQEKKITSELDELKKDLVQHVPENQQIEVREGYFDRRIKETWVYSDAVGALQAEEKAKGIATKKGSIYIQYTLKK